MALQSRLVNRVQLLVSLQQHNFSSFLNRSSNNLLTSEEKSRDAISLLKEEENPDRILDICRSAYLKPDIRLDRIAFSIAISKLKDSNHFDAISLFLEELKTRRPDFQNESFLCHCIILYGQAGMLDHAIRTFEQIHDMGVNRTVKSLNALLFSCVLAEKHNEVERMLLEYPRKYGIEPDIETYNTVVKALCLSRSSGSVYSILTDMEKNQVKPNAEFFGTCISGFYKEYKFEDVGKMLDLMEKHGMHPGLPMYNIRIKSLCKLKRSADAKTLLDRMSSRNMKVNSETYCLLIHGFCKEGNYDEAKKLIIEMSYRGCPPDSACYFTLVSFLCQAKDFEAGLRFCRESMSKGWIPNFSTMKLLVDGLVSFSKVDEARELIGRVRKFSKNACKWKEIEKGLPK